MFKVFVALVVSFYALVGHTADRKRNGGSIVICEVNGARSYELLDLYEGANYRNFVLRSMEGMSAFEIVAEVLKTIEKLDPNRAALYSKFLISFSRESYWQDELPIILDYGFRVIGPGCHLEQGAIQEDNSVGKKYIFNNALFYQLNARSQAGLIIHEFVYRDGLANKPEYFKDSLRVRYFTGYLFSEKIKNDSQREYERIVKMMEMGER